MFRPSASLKNISLKLFPRSEDQACGAVKRLGQVDPLRSWPARHDIEGEAMRCRGLKIGYLQQEAGPNRSSGARGGEEGSAEALAAER